MMSTLVGSNPRKGLTRPHGKGRQINYSVVGRSMKTLQERFDEKYTPEPNSGCWLWTGAVVTEDQPYGVLWKGGRQHRAHRVSYELHVGLIPEGFCCLHRCDLPACVNPNHLFLGTHLDNEQDKISKGRKPKGSQVPNSKLTESRAKQIKKAKGTLKEIAAEHRVHYSTVGLIKQGKRWAHV